MKIAIREGDLSDGYLRFAAQIGADGLDLHAPASLPGLEETGSVDEPRLQALMERVRGFGLDVFRVTPPRPLRFLRGEPGGEEEVEGLRRLLPALGGAGVHFMSMPIHRRWNAGFRGLRKREHRGGYTMNAFDPEKMRREVAARPLEWTEAEIAVHLERCVELYRSLVPVAEASGVGLVLHPSDPPLADAELGPERWLAMVDAVPSPSNGLLYCVGTRQETGVDVCSEIRRLGSAGKILHVHFRNVSGTVGAPEGYSEVALDDGDLDMAAALRALRDAGYRGALQVDHLPEYAGDDGRQSAARAVGYIRGLLASA